jgi:hypothetical protein
MQQTKTINGIKCLDCGFEAPYKSNNAMLFLIFIAMIFLSAYFLPLIIVALAYLVWIMSKPSQKVCPKCKSENVTDIAIEMDQSQTKPEQSKN